MGEDPDTTARLLRRRLQSTTLDLPVSGASMGSTIASGSTVTVAGSHEPRRGEVWAFVGADGSGIVVHRVRHLTADAMIGRGDGNAYDDRRVPRSHLIGRVRAARGPDGSVRRFGTVDRMAGAARLRARYWLRKAVGRGRRPA